MLHKVLRNIRKYHKLIAAIILGSMFALGLFSMLGDSAIVDEIAHIPAGYSYLKYSDYRLNPEHPPLIKDLAAMPLMFMNLKFPTNIAAWNSDINGQWEAGWNFIYHIGNNADAIIFCARLPILILSVILGYIIYHFCEKRYGVQTALLALILYAFSPSIIAHSRFVTTDLGIAAFTFFAFLAFFVFIERPRKQTVLLAAGFFALAQLAKFSAITLIPFFIGLTAIAVWAKKSPQPLGKRALTYFGYLAVMFALAFVMVWLFYIPHVWNMPSGVQDALIQGSLPKGYYEKFGRAMVATNDPLLLRALYQYALGVLMVFNRVSSGNITYFLGQVTNQSFIWYFPVSFVMKTQLPLLLMIVMTAIFSLWQIIRHWPKRFFAAIKNYADVHFVELSFILYIAFYSYISIKGNLNLGIRHLFPMLPMVFILVAKKAVDIRKALHGHRRATYSGALIIATGLYMLTPLIIYPRYVPYINSAFGGGGAGYKYLTDSNVDWGQDLKRLAEWIKARPEVDKIAVDYFGGGSPAYYLCERRYYPNGELVANSDGYNCDTSQYLEWHAQEGVPPTQYIAVSETFLMNDKWTAATRGDAGYTWLREKTPVAKIGDSIYIFKVR